MKRSSNANKTSKVENYTDNVSADFSRELYIQPDASTHGTDGYVHVAYPRYFYNQSRKQVRCYSRNSKLTS